MTPSLRIHPYYYGNCYHPLYSVWKSVAIIRKRAAIMDFLGGEVLTGKGSTGRTFKR